MDYEKMWNTLKAESGGRWCQPHPLSKELLTIGELMRNMERRASESMVNNEDIVREPCVNCDSKTAWCRKKCEDYLFWEKYFDEDGFPRSHNTASDAISDAIAEQFRLYCLSITLSETDYIAIGNFIEWVQQAH